MKAHYTIPPVSRDTPMQRRDSSSGADRRRVLVRLLAEAYCTRLQRQNGSQLAPKGFAKGLGSVDERSELLPILARG